MGVSRRYLGASGSGSDLCSNGAVQISFTNFSWPVGVKRDRGLNITFVQDVILPPGGVVLGANPGANDASTSVAISFKDDTNHFRCARAPACCLSILGAQCVWPKALGYSS